MSVKTIKTFLQEKTNFSIMIEPLLKESGIEINDRQLEEVDFEDLLHLLDDKNGDMTGAYEQIVVMQDDSYIYCMGFIPDEESVDPAMLMLVFDLVQTLSMVNDQVSLIHHIHERCDTGRRIVVPVLLKLEGIEEFIQKHMFN